MPKTVDAVIQTTEEAPDDGKATEGEGYEEGSMVQIVIFHAAYFWCVSSKLVIWPSKSNELIKPAKMNRLKANSEESS